MESRRQVRQMMLYAVQARAHRLTWERPLEKSRKTRAGTTIPYSAQHQIDVGTFGKKISDLTHLICATVLIECDVLHIREPNACLTTAIFNSLGGKPGPMFNSTKALLLGSSDQLAVAQQSCRRVRMESIQSQDDHF
jgi:hypothetical protein